MAAYDRAIAIKPENAEAWRDRGAVVSELKMRHRFLGVDPGPLQTHVIEFFPVVERSEKIVE